MAVLDIGGEGVDGVEGLSVGLTGALGQGEEAAGDGLLCEGVEETLLPDHFQGIPQADAAVVDWVLGVEGGDFSRLIEGGEEVARPGLGADGQVAGVEVGRVEVP